MSMENSNDNKYIMIDHLHRMFKLLIEIKSKLYPMAVALDINNRLIINIDIKIDDQPSSEEMIRRYDKKLNKMLEKKKIQSYCIAVDTIASKEPNSKEIDTIAFMIKNDHEKQAEVIYLSYILNKNGNFEVIDIWKDKRTYTAVN